MFTSSMYHVMSVVESSLLQGLRERSQVLQWQSQQLDVDHVREGNRLQVIEGHLYDIHSRNNNRNGYHYR